MATHNEFMVNLINTLVEKRGIQEKSAAIYVRKLRALNNDEMFKNLNFLKDVEKVCSTIDNLNTNTNKLNYYSAICSVLAMYDSKPMWKKLYNIYTSKMNDAQQPVTDVIKSNVKTETQAKNWMDWTDVVARKDEYRNKVLQFVNNKIITKNQWNDLISYFVLCLYTDIPPRRNEYIDMYVVKQMKGDDKSKNWLVTGDKKLVFNVYKTSKFYGVQTVSYDGSENFNEALDWYLKFHPLFRKNGIEFKLLVAYDGTIISAQNAITRILNSVFGKNIGSTMLRHIYLSSKYGKELEQQEEDAKAMGHSVEEQKTYIKHD